MYRSDVGAARGGAGAAPAHVARGVCAGDGVGFNSNRVLHDEAAQQTQEAPLTVRISDVFSGDVVAFSAATRAHKFETRERRARQHEMRADAAHQALTFAPRCAAWRRGAALRVRAGAHRRGRRRRV